MSARRALDCALAALTLLIGCSWLVDPLAKEARCFMADAGEKNVCPQGLQCRDGLCKTPCRTDVPDVCGDGIDNDCDGHIDEVDSLGRDTCGDHIDNDCDGIVDEGSDSDGDGYSWCGDTVGGGANSKPRDCDDSMASVYPGAPEQCDGRDNDCDDIIDEQSVGAAALCPAGSSCLGQRCVIASCANEGAGVLACAADERCDAQTGQCVSQQCDDVTCAEDQYCDATTHSCRTRQPQGNGQPCSADTDCSSGLCIDAAALRFASGTRVCGQACCSDQQCSTGERCFASGTGARSCLPEELIPANSPHECTADNECMSTEICSLSKDHTLTGPLFVEREDVIASTCRTNTLAIGLPSGDRCTSYPECATFTCVPSLFGSLCSNPCGSSNDCADLSTAAKRDGALGAYCRYTDVTLDNSPPDYAAICVVRRQGETGPGEYGAPCSSASDCLDAGCVGATATTKGHCSSTCCRDSHCGPREDGKPIACRPFAFGASATSGARYEMRCDI